MADRIVMRMTPHQRLMYRALCQVAMFCSSRPYLPDNDEELYLLADADSLEHWKANRAVVLQKFYKIGVDGNPMLAHKRLLSDWDRHVAAQEQKIAAGRASAKSRAQRAFNGRSTEPTAVEQSNGNALCNTGKAQNRDSITISSEAETLPEQQNAKLTPGLDDTCPVCKLDIFDCPCEKTDLILTRYFIEQLACKNPKADAPPTNWQRLWVPDFQKLQLYYADDDIMKMIRHSLSGKWLKYTFRPLTIVEHAEEIAKQLKIKPKPIPEGTQFADSVKDKHKLGKDRRTSEQRKTDERLEDEFDLVPMCEGGCGTSLMRPGYCSDCAAKKDIAGPNEFAAMIGAKRTILQ